MYGVILAGGSGTRFWPKSRPQSPKQLLKIVEPGTMLQNTVQRLLPFIAIENIFLATNHLHAMESCQQLHSFNFIPDHLLAEPVNRNTTAAIGLAATFLIKKDPDAIMGIFPADHVISNPEDFIADLRRAEAIASKGYMVTLGIKPDKPETGYGYIKQGLQLKEFKSVFQAEKFVEKPDLSTARQFLEQGNYYWNCGVFVWKASTILEELKKFAPEFHVHLETIATKLEVGKGTYPYQTLNKEGVELFSSLPSISIDYAVMEKSSNTALIPTNLKWSDVGAWSALDDVSEKDSDGNIFSENVIALECKDTIIQSHDRLVGALGTNNLIIVDSPDALLVCNKERAQDVKKLVETLNEQGRSEGKNTSLVKKDWGTYTILESGLNYLIKRIEVRPGEALSLQSHEHRSEHWTIVSGNADIALDDNTFQLKSNDSITIPQKSKHRLGNPGETPLIIIEVQIGTLLDENDIKRYEDKYGRC